MTDRKTATIARKLGMSVADYTALRYTARKRLDARKEGRKNV